MPASDYKNKKKRKVIKFTLSEISAVGKPAQEPALIALSKSAAEERQLQHRQNQSGGDEMSDALKKQLEDLQKKQADSDALIAKQNDTIARMAKEAAMSGETKEYYSGLSDEDKGLFLAKSAAVQEAEVQNAKLANAVIYKDVNGTEYRKSDDPRLIQMAKDADEQRATLKKMQEQNAELQLKKQLDEFKHLPGDEKTRTALLKSVNAIEDESERNAALESLRAHDSNLSKYFEVTGTSISDDGKVVDTNPKFFKSGSSELDQLVEKHIKDNPGTPVEKAFDAVLSTPEGEEAYSRMEYAQQ